MYVFVQREIDLKHVISYSASRSFKRSQLLGDFILVQSFRSSQSNWLHIVLACDRAYPVLTRLIDDLESVVRGLELQNPAIVEFGRKREPVVPEPDLSLGEWEVRSQHQLQVAGGKVMVREREPVTANLQPELVICQVEPDVLKLYGLSQSIEIRYEARQSAFFDAEHLKLVSTLRPQLRDAQPGAPIVVLDLGE